jgi:hypothetical protein
MPGKKARCSNGARDIIDARSLIVFINRTLRHITYYPQHKTIPTHHPTTKNVDPRKRTIPQQHHVRRLATLWLRRNRGPHLQRRFDLAPPQGSSAQHGVPRASVSASRTLSRGVPRTPTTIACEVPIAGGGHSGHGSGRRGSGSLLLPKAHQSASGC